MNEFLTWRLSASPRWERNTPPSQPIHSSVAPGTGPKRAACTSAWTPLPMNESSVVGEAGVVAEGDPQPRRRRGLALGPRQVGAEERRGGGRVDRPGRHRGPGRGGGAGAGDQPPGRGRDEGRRRRLVGVGAQPVDATAG